MEIKLHKVNVDFVYVLYDFVVTIYVCFYFLCEYHIDSGTLRHELMI